MATFNPSVGAPPATGGADYDHLLKLLLVGDSGVGKTSILLNYVSNEFVDRDKPTIGVDLKVKVVQMQGKRIKLSVWDSAGQERFRTLTSAYYRGAHGIILVFDVTCRKSFDDVREWLKEVDTYSTNEDAVKLLVGNKIDKATERQVSREEAQDFARTNHMIFLETSAKTSSGVQHAFQELLQKILDSPTLISDSLSATNKHKSASAAAASKASSTPARGAVVDLKQPAQGQRTQYCCGLFYSDA